MQNYPRFTNSLEKQVKEFLPAQNDFAMKKVFGDSRLYPGVVSYLEFDALSITPSGIRDALFTKEYRMRKTLTKLGSRRGAGVRFYPYI